MRRWLAASIVGVACIVGSSAAWGQTAVPTWTPTPTETPTVTQTPTITDTPTITPTITDTPTPTSTPTLTFTPTPTFTSTPTFTPTLTVTPTLTPTVTNTPITTRAPHVARDVAITVTLLNAVTTAVPSGAVYVGDWTNKTVQITVGSTCTSYTMLIEGLNDGLVWATLYTKANTDYAAGVSGIFTVNESVKYIQARVSAITDCTLSAYVHGVP